MHNANNQRTTAAAAAVHTSNNTTPTTTRQGRGKSASKRAERLTILYPDAVRDGVAVLVLEQRPHVLVDALGVRRGGREARTDRPHLRCEHRRKSQAGGSETTREKKIERGMDERVDVSKKRYRGFALGFSRALR